VEGSSSSDESDLSSSSSSMSAEKKLPGLRGELPKSEQKRFRQLLKLYRVQFGKVPIRVGDPD
jgi:hypothetical protein